MYQPVLPHTDPVPPNTSQYRPILTIIYQCPSMSLGTVSLATSSQGTMSLGTMSLRTIVPRNNVPHENCSLRQLFNGIIFLATIIPLFLYKWSFAKRMVLRMTKTCFLLDWAEIRTRHVPSIEDPQYKKGPMVQELEQSDR